MYISGLLDNAKQFLESKFSKLYSVNYIWHFQLNKTYQYLGSVWPFNFGPLAADLVGIYPHQSKI